MKVYGLKNCDTCRKALKSLREAGHSPEFVDVRETPLNRETLQRFLGHFGEILLNTKSTTWRGLSEAERGSAPIELLLEHPALMKRPVIEGGTELTLGWKGDVIPRWLDV